MLCLAKKLALLPLLALVVPLAACGSSDNSSGGSDHETLTVLAASSLTKTFTELGRKFESAHPGTTVKLSFGGSSDLVEQITSGAPADVFASADAKNMDKLGGDAENRRNFASNVLEIAVPPGNPATITGFADLAKPGVKLVVCAPAVPCGAATAAVAAKAGVTLKPVSEEQSVTDVLGKVTSGEADAGVVYVTDVKAAGDKVEGVAFPESSSVVNTYPIATVKDSKHAKLAREFLDLVVGADGQQVLADAGFGKP
ncbi:molybdate ABC transporter substrate-binding protein [Nocardioides sp. AN3]